MTTEPFDPASDPALDPQTQPAPDPEQPLPPPGGGPRPARYTRPWGVRTRDAQSRAGAGADPRVHAGRPLTAMTDKKGKGSATARKANATAAKEGKSNPRTSSAAQSELGKKGGKKSSRSS